MMRRRDVILVLALVTLVAGFAVFGLRAEDDADDAAAAVPAQLPESALFDDLSATPDVIYLMANSSVVFGPDPNARSEEITFAGPVTSPKWPMDGYDRRQLRDGRQQIDIELTDSQLTGESYLLGDEVILGEHPDLPSLGSITESDRDEISSTRQDKARELTQPPVPRRPTDPGDKGALATYAPPADFVVARKVLMTTAKGILYNETPVPVRGKINAIPPVWNKNGPQGVNVFQGMELPIPLLNEDGNLDGWFYSKAHMAFAVLPEAIDRGTLEGTLVLRSGERTEEVVVRGPIEFHHGAQNQGEDGSSTDVEVMVLALRGTSELLGGDIMLIEAFSDRRDFSEGTFEWTSGQRADSAFDLFFHMYTPSTKLYNDEPLVVQGTVDGFQRLGRLNKGQLDIPIVSSSGTFVASGPRPLYDEAEREVASVEMLQFRVVPRDDNQG